MSATVIRPSFGVTPTCRTPLRTPTNLERLCGLADDLNAFVNTLPRHLQEEGRRLVVRLYQAEQRIKEQGIDTSRQLSDEDARRVLQIRQGAVEMAELTQQAERQRSAFQEIGDACEFPDEVLSDPEVIAIFQEAVQ